MTRPSDIPERVWDAAVDPAHVVFDAAIDLYETGACSADIRVVIARAIMAETERCAQVADEHAEAKWGGEGKPNAVLRITAHSIASAIRGEA